MSIAGIERYQRFYRGRTRLKADRAIARPTATHCRHFYASVEGELREESRLLHMHSDVETKELFSRIEASPI